MTDKGVLPASRVTTPDERRAPVGPRGHWLLGNVREFRRDILGTLQKWVET